MQMSLKARSVECFYGPWLVEDVAREAAGIMAELRIGSQTVAFLHTVLEDT